METWGRSLARLHNDNRLADQKEVLTSSQVIFKDSDITTFLLYTEKPFTAKEVEKIGSATIIRNGKDMSYSE